MKALLLIFVLASAALAQAAHSVTLAWTDTVNPAGVAYYVYRTTGPCTGTFTKITATAISPKTYVDSAVASGVTYCYYVTAFLNALESTPSNKAPAIIPPDPPTGLSVTVQ